MWGVSHNYRLECVLMDLQIIYTIIELFKEFFFNELINWYQF
jgi:hypothetical protein